MKARRGNIALVYFPNSDLSTIKQRPVLIVQEDDLRTGIPQLVVAMISSNTRRAEHPSRVLLLLGSPDATGTGLRTDSVVMADNLATVQLSLISKRVGRLRDMTMVDRSLRTTLGL